MLSLTVSMSSSYLRPDAPGASGVPPRLRASGNEESGASAVALGNTSTTTLSPRREANPLAQPERAERAERTASPATPDPVDRAERTEGAQERRNNGVRTAQTAGATDSSNGVRATFSQRALALAQAERQAQNTQAAEQVYQPNQRSVQADAASQARSADSAAGVAGAPTEPGAPDTSATATAYSGTNGTRGTGDTATAVANPADRTTGRDYAENGQRLTYASLGALAYARPAPSPTTVAVADAGVSQQTRPPESTPRSVRDPASGPANNTNDNGNGPQARDAGAEATTRAERAAAARVDTTERADTALQQQRTRDTADTAVPA